MKRIVRLSLALGLLFSPVTLTAQGNIEIMLAEGIRSVAGTKIDPVILEQCKARGAEACGLVEPTKISREFRVAQQIFMLVDISKLRAGSKIEVDWNVLGPKGRSVHRQEVAAVLPSKWAERQVLRLHHATSFNHDGAYRLEVNAKGVGRRSLTFLVSQ